MMDKTDEKVMASIRRREGLCEPFLRVGKILDVGGVGNYLSLCSNRIADAELIDGENVRIDFINFPDLELTAEGVRICRKILECYVSDDIIADAHEALCEETEARECANAISRLLKKMKLRELARAYIKSGARIRRFVITEICQRLILVRCARKMRSLFYSVFVRIKYRGLFKIIRQFRQDMPERWLNP